MFDKDRGKEHMKICADFANCAKHYSLKPYRIRISQGMRLTGESVNVQQVGAKLSIGGSDVVQKEAIQSGGYCIWIYAWSL